MKRPAFLGGIRGKLIAVFVLIKVVPLILLAWFAWHAASQLGDDVSRKAGGMADAMLDSIKTVGNTVTTDSIRALDIRSREAIEAMTTDTAKEIASFLYDRDRDISLAAATDPSEAAFRRFLADRTRPLHVHGPWKLAEDGKSWIPETPVAREAKVTRPVLTDNAKDFHARPAEYLGETQQRPLFVEMTYIDLNGQEKIKVTSGGLTEKNLKNVADRRNTFVGAETYFAELKKLKPGQIHVSDVIGAYVPTQLIGPYLPAALEKAGKPFKPEDSAYAGTENPVGKRFRGIVRWAMPVVKNGAITGYVTLALDHDHIRQFSDRLMPTEERYTPITDASRAITPLSGITKAAPSPTRATTSSSATTRRPAIRQPHGWTRSCMKSGRQVASRHTSFSLASRTSATRISNASRPRRRSRPALWVWIVAI